MRRPDWPQRLTAVLVASRRRGFAYGHHDCCTHAADCVEAVTGVDVAAEWRGHYGEPVVGLAIAGIRRVGQLPGRYFAEVPVAMAQRGDIAIARVGRSRRGRLTSMLMVVDGVWLRGPAGAIAPRSAAYRTWRVE